MQFCHTYYAADLAWYALFWMSLTLLFVLKVFGRLVADCYSHRLSHSHNLTSWCSWSMCIKRPASHSMSHCHRRWISPVTCPERSRVRVRRNCPFKPKMCICSDFMVIICHYNSIPHGPVRPDTNGMVSKGIPLGVMIRESSLTSNFQAPVH